MSDADITAFEIFPWNRNFETGIEKIDEQHKVLVEILNRLAWHFASSTSELECGHILDELAGLPHDKLYRALEQQVTDYEEQLEFLAYSDPVTGLMNRNGILREIRDVMLQKQVPVGSAALISIDLDNFHKVNARFGEESADRLLGLLARCWREVMAHGAQLARISGDEFVVLLADNGKVEAQLKALIRWEHPIKGTLSPISFLPALEHHPLIIDIGEWVIEQAFRQMTTWDSQGLTLDVGVNIAAMHLQQPGFTDNLAGILARYPHYPGLREPWRYFFSG